MQSGDMQTLVKEVMGRAYRHAGGHAALLLAIRPLIRKKDHQETSASGWVTGRSVPPADVLLAAAKVAHVSLDELLFGESLVARQDRLERELGELRKTIEDRPLLAGDGPRGERE